MSAHELGWFCATAVVSTALTWIARRRAIARGLLDVPNARSSHTLPTPRGGGVGFVSVILTSMLILKLSGSLISEIVVGLAACSGAIAVVGLVDDRRGLPAVTRFLVHAAAAGITLWLLFEALGDSAVVAERWRWLTLAVLLLGTIWSVNLFNFMDGIDGIAASQSLFMSLAAAGFVMTVPDAVGWAALLLATAGATAGFLVWNWPPARIFMGDIGSGFLGFWFAALGIAMHLDRVLSIWVSLILGMAFIADASVTLGRRVLSGQRWYEAHRTHAYQNLSRRFGSHGVVTLGLWAVNAATVLPTAVLAHQIPQIAPWATAGLFALLAAACWLAGAGRSEGQDHLVNTVQTT